MPVDKKKNIFRRLLLSFLFLVSIFLLFAVLSFHQFHSAAGLTLRIFNHPLFVSNAALQSNVSILKMHRNMKDVVLLQSPPAISRAIAKVNEEEQRVFSHLDIVRERILGEEGKALEVEARQLFMQWRPIRQEVIDLVRAGRRAQAAEITIGKGARHVSLLEAKMMGLTDYARNKASQFMQQSEQARVRAGRIVAFFLAFGALAFFIVAFFTLRWTSRAETSLKEREEKFRLLADNTLDVIWTMSPDLEFTYVNPAVERLTGYTPEEWIGTRLRSHCDPDEFAIMTRVIEEEIRKGRRHNGTVFETEVIGKDGSPIPVEIHGTVIFDEDGAPLMLQGVTRDLTTRKAFERHILRLNRVLQSIRNVNQLIVHEHDRQSLIEKACRLLVENRDYVSAVIVLTGETGEPRAWAESGIGERFQALADAFRKGRLPPCCQSDRALENLIVVADRAATCRLCPIGDLYADLDALCMPLRHGETGFGYLIVSLTKGLVAEKDEQTLLAEMAGDIAYALGVLQRDLAREKAEKERRSLEGRLLQSQKMEAVGRLAGGVAHDYNNMLSLIIGYAEMALEKVDPARPIGQDLTEILAAARRSADITRQLLAYARRQTIAPRVIDLNETVEGMLKMLRRLIGEDIDLSWIPGADLWPVKLDPAQVHQILVNLCINARDAIPGVGRITIETGKVTFDEAYCADHPGFSAGDYVLLAVSDDGTGMDRELLDHIFEPFFTTKGMVSGSGLGLSTVYGIVKQNEGFINVYSEPGKGSTFRIYLSRHEGAAPELRQPIGEKVAAGLGETVLVVEDEAPILDLTRKMLEGLGYRVMTAATPRAAVVLAEETRTPIRLLITDVVMPEMNGRELAERVRRHHPNVRSLFMSGYTANVIAHHGVLDKGVHFIQKPFSRMELAVKVGEALERGSYLQDEDR